MRSIRRISQVAVWTLMLLAATLAAAAAQAQAQVPALSINDPAAVTEGDSGTRPATFTVTLSEASGSDVTATYATTGAGTALAPGDFTAVAPTQLTIPAGSLTATIDVAIVGDVLDEADAETFQLQLSLATNATIARPIGTGTITDDDPLPSLSVTDASVVEGTNATRTLSFSVTLAQVSGLNVTVSYTTADVPGGAVSIGSPTDYTPRSNALTFNAGTTTQTATVTISSLQSDALDELDETFELRLSAPTNATIADATGIGTIVDDDGPAIAVNDITVTEGNAGTTPATFTVSLTVASVQPVSVIVASANDSAFTPADYVALATGTRLTIAPGALTATVTVNVIGDTVDESDEKVRLNLSDPVGGTVSDGIGLATIADDDAEPVMSIADVTVKEGSVGATSASLTVSLSEPSERLILVAYTTEDGTATEDVDYAEATELITLSSGQKEVAISIPIGADRVVENDETFLVRLLAPAGAAVSQDVATVTIIDDDLNAANTPSLSVADVEVPKEGDSGTRPATFRVELTSPPGRSVGVSYTTADGTATAPGDYVAAAGRVVFAPGELTKDIEIAVRGDTDVDGSHSFTLKLSEPSNATISDGSARATITDDDAGAGPITLPAVVDASRLFCAKATKRCTGLRVGWTVYTRGTLVFELTALAPPRTTTPAAGPRRAAGARLIRIVRTTSTVTKARTDRKLLRPTPGRRARALLRGLRRDRVRELRVKVTFTNRVGDQKATTGRVRLRLFR